MLIFFGSKTVHLKTIELRNVNCSNCDAKDSLSISLFRKHYHIFWIPMFPVGKTGFSQCQNCKNVLEPKEMPDRLKNEYENLKKDTKGPLWQFAGLWIILLLFVLGMFIGGNSNKLDAEYLNSPKVGDIYKYKVETGNYSTLKVVNITKDSVFVSPNTQEISKRSRIYKIDKSKNYSELTYGISIKNLKEMYETKEIYDVKR